METSKNKNYHFLLDYFNSYNLDKSDDEKIIFDIITEDHLVVNNRILYYTRLKVFNPLIMKESSYFYCNYYDQNLKEQVIDELCLHLLILVIKNGKLPNSSQIDFLTKETIYQY